MYLHFIFHMADELGLDYRDVITDIVGADSDETEVCFTVHTEPIKQKSVFFEKACTTNFKEAEEKVVRLPETRPSVFEDYLHWIYTGTITAIENNPDNSLLQNRCLTRLYLAADKLDDILLRNAAIDSLLTLFSCGQLKVNSSLFSETYEGTTENSPLRRLLVDIYLSTSNTADWVQREAEHLPRQFLVDLVCGRMEKSNEKTPAPNKNDRCKYHEHSQRSSECWK